MKHVKKVLPLIVLFASIIVGCDVINKALTKGISHTASRINSIQAIGGSKEFAFVDIEYVFTGTGVSGEKAVFSRSGSNKSDTIAILLAGTIYTDIDTLKANSAYTYSLALWNGSRLKDYDQINVVTLPIIKITTPADTFSSSNLKVEWNKLSYDGKDYLDYEVALYDAAGLDLTNPDLKSLLAMTKPLEGPFKVSLSESDSKGSYTFSASPPALFKAYVVKVTTKKATFDKLSNKSTAFRPFVWVNTL